MGGVSGRRRAPPGPRLSRVSEIDVVWKVPAAAWLRSHYSKLKDSRSTPVRLGPYSTAIVCAKSAVQARAPRLPPVAHIWEGHSDQSQPASHLGMMASP